LNTNRIRKSRCRDRFS